MEAGGGEGEGVGLTNANASSSASANESEKVFNLAVNSLQPAALSSHLLTEN